MSDDRIQPDAPHPRVKFQFTIRSMLLVTVAVALLCSFLYALPNYAAGMVFLFGIFVVPGPLVCLTIFGTSHHRAFAVGTLVPWLLFCFLLEPAGFLGPFYRLGVEERFMLVLPWGSCFLSGYLSLWTLRWIERQNPAQKVEPPPVRDTPLAKRR